MQIAPTAPENKNEKMEEIMGGWVGRHVDKNKRDGREAMDVDGLTPAVDEGG